jgi:hypothetical protein
VVVPLATPFFLFVARAEIDATCRLGEQFFSQTKKSSDALIAELVEDVAPLRRRGHEATVAQAGQVIRHIRLRKTCPLDESSDREWPITQGFEQREAGHIRKSAKKLGLDRCRARDLSHHLFSSFISVTADMIAIGDGDVKLRMV